MTEWTVEIHGPALGALSESIRQGAVLEIVNGNGVRLLAEGTIGRIDGVKIELFSNEHPPPHFRVKYQGSTANYRISDCSRLNGAGEVLKYEKNIRLWWGENKQDIIASWDKSRPAGCPVGEYRADNQGGPT
jgi:hypothetical protein